MNFKDLKPIHQENLITLRDGLIRVYGATTHHYNFSMKQHQYPSGRRMTKHLCYTSASTLGHGPILGMGNCKSDCKGGWWEWGHYGLVTFGVMAPTKVWQFLFGPSWTDNIQEAIARLSMYIAGFDPQSESWDYTDSYT